MDHIYKRTPLKKTFSVDSIITAINRRNDEDFFFSGEMHDFWELVCVFDGEVTVTADDAVYSLTKGDIIFHKPMEFHRIWASNSTKPHLYILSFGILGGGLAPLENAIIHADAKTVRRVGKLIETSNEYISDNADEREGQRLCCDIETLLLDLIPLASDRTQTESKGRRAEYKLIVSVLEENTESDLQLEDIAALCNMSLSQLKKVFHRYSDIGIMRYYQKVKLREAINLLNAGVTVKEVSERLCFASASYFSVAFKREFGCSPREYVQSKTFDNGCY